MISCILCFFVFTATINATCSDASFRDIQSCVAGSISGWRWSRWSAESVLPWPVLWSVSTCPRPVSSSNLVFRVALLGSKYTLSVTGPTWNNFGQLLVSLNFNLLMYNYWNPVMVLWTGALTHNLIHCRYAFITGVWFDSLTYYSFSICRIQMD